jgi:hypothetical protein
LLEREIAIAAIDPRVARARKVAIKTNIVITTTTMEHTIVNPHPSEVIGSAAGP